MSFLTVCLFFHASVAHGYITQNLEDYATNTSGGDCDARRIGFEMEASSGNFEFMQWSGPTQNTCDDSFTEYSRNEFTPANPKATFTMEWGKLETPCGNMFKYASQIIETVDTIELGEGEGKVMLPEMIIESEYGGGTSAFEVISGPVPVSNVFQRMNDFDNVFYAGFNGANSKLSISQTWREKRAKMTAVTRFTWQYSGEQVPSSVICPVWLNDGDGMNQQSSMEAATNYRAKWTKTAKDNKCTGRTEITKHTAPGMHAMLNALCGDCGSAFKIRRSKDNQGVVTAMHSTMEFRLSEAVQGGLFDVAMRQSQKERGKYAWTMAVQIGQALTNTGANALFPNIAGMLKKIRTDNFAPDTSFHMFQGAINLAVWMILTYDHIICYNRKYGEDQEHETEAWKKRGLDPKKQFGLFPKVRWSADRGFEKTSPPLTWATSNQFTHRHNIEFLLNAHNAGIPEMQNTVVDDETIDEKYWNLGHVMGFKTTGSKPERWINNALHPMLREQSYLENSIETRSLETVAYGLVDIIRMEPDDFYLNVLRPAVNYCNAGESEMCIVLHDLKAHLDNEPVDMHPQNFMGTKLRPPPPLRFDPTAERFMESFGANTWAETVIKPMIGHGLSPDPFFIAEFRDSGFKGNQHIWSAFTTLSSSGKNARLQKVHTYFNNLCGNTNPARHGTLLKSDAR